MTEKSLERRFDSLIIDAVALARSQGCKNPRVYFEGCSGLHIIDGLAHPEGGQERGNIVINLRWPRIPGVDIDVGGW